MNKTKTFLCTIPFQPKGETPDKDGLKPVQYEQKGNNRLAYGKTRFPIIPVIHGYAEKNDTIRIIAILTEGVNYTYNYVTYFEPEITALVKQNGYQLDKIEQILSPNSEDIESQLQLFTDIINTVGDNEELYACITYGTKPTPIVQFIALNYVYQLKKNISIGCIAYGRFMHHDPNQNNGIYDQTALFYMNSIINKLADIKAPHPEKAISAILGIGGIDYDE